MEPLKSLVKCNFFSTTKEKHLQWSPHSLTLMMNFGEVHTKLFMSAGTKVTKDLK